MVRALFETAYNERVYNPAEDANALDALVCTRQQWAEQGKTVVFTAGGYDLAHLNHTASLLRAKILGARHRYETLDGDSHWLDLSLEEQADITAESFKNDTVKLVVSVKGDIELGQRKSFQPDKGNVQRPIQDWRTRVMTLLSIGMPSTFSCNPNQLVDAVTIDDNVDPRLAESSNRNLVELVRTLDPDVWQIYFESTRLLDFVARGELGGKTRVFKSESGDYFIDGQRNEPLSTTLVVNKILGRLSTGSMIDYDQT